MYDSLASVADAVRSKTAEKRTWSCMVIEIMNWNENLNSANGVIPDESWKPDVANCCAKL